MGTEGLFPEAKWAGREADQSPPSSVDVKTSGAIPPLPQYIFVAWYLRDNFSFTTET